ncbi:MAG: DUF3795 domain-containing protein [bacterium]
MEKINENLIASCGMNCGICKAYLRTKNRCVGCRNIGATGPKTRVSCKIKNCSELKGRYCFDCGQFPCDRLKHLDKRYQTKYGMSEIENLENIRDNGIDNFIENERNKWVTDNGIICVHDKKIYNE